MYDVKITALRKADYKDLQLRYENPIEHACDVKEGQTWVAREGSMPEGMCDSAWESMRPFVEAWPAARATSTTAGCATPTAPSSAATTASAP